MEHIITRRRGVKRLLAFLLCMASVFGMIPTQAFAFRRDRKQSSGWAISMWALTGSIIMRRRPHSSCLWNDGCAAVPRQRLPALGADSFGREQPAGILCGEAALPIALLKIPIHPAETSCQLLEPGSFRGKRGSP